jgi:LPS-assembly protein
MRGDRRGIRWGLVCVLAIFAGLFRVAWAQEPVSREVPALLQADDVVYDKELQTVTARGEVEVAHGERILLADSLTYNLDTDVITAQGDVSLLEPSGEVIFADYVEVTGDLREGAIRSFRMLLTDRSRLAAANAVRVDGRLTQMRKVVFSPCEPCREDHERAPLWQIKAERVTHDQQEKMLKYRNARMELFGVPVIYTPYFEHPDPTVKRKSGFLSPSFGFSDELGTRFQIPYYWAISPQRDLTVEPIYTTKQGVVMTGQYRARTTGGQYSLAGSATIADKTTGRETKTDVFRGHLDVEGEFNIDRIWRWGFDARRTSDDTYLRVYDFDFDRFLKSEAYLEGFRGSNYFSARAFSYQGQSRRDDDRELPIVLPEIRYSYVGRPEAAGGRFFAEAGALGLTRIDGRDSRRLSSSVGWMLPYTDNLGGITELTTVVHGDIYAANGVDETTDAVDPPDATAAGEDFQGRLFPQAALSYRYPMARQGFLGREVLEPRVQLVVGPNGGNPGEIPNEDSRDFEFDDTNLFRLNRFPGRDRISSGQRIDYGATYSIFGEGYSYASGFLGQSYRINSDDAIPDAAGEDGDFSDIVGRVDVRPLRYLDLSYRFRLDEDNFSAQRSEIGMRAGPPSLQTRIDYTFLKDETDSESASFGQREEIYAELRSRFARYWSAYASQRRDLTTNQTLRTRFGLVYHDECFLVDLRAQRDEFRDRDVEPDDQIFVTITFKHLGQFVAEQ